MLRTPVAAMLPLALALGQSEKAPLRFEVCDIQVSKIADQRQMKADFLPGGRVDVRGIPLKNIIAAVNKVQEDLVIGPGWMNSARYDIVAKAAPGSTEDQLFEMGRTMLAERFKMVAHTGQKVVPVYVLVVGTKGVRMTEATGSAGPGAGAFHGVICPMVPPAPGQNDPLGVIHRDCRAVSMADLARMLPQIAPAYLEGSPVVDLTGLKGLFDFKLDWMALAAFHAATTAGNAGAPGDEWTVSIFDALERLGLRLENRKYPMDTVVVDSIKRTPTDN